MVCPYGGGETVGEVGTSAIGHTGRPYLAILQGGSNGGGGCWHHAGARGGGAAGQTMEAAGRGASSSHGSSCSEPHQGRLC